MYALVLATLFTTGNDVPDFGRHGCRGGCWGCSGCYGGCYGCYGGCSGCYGGCYGCYGGCYGGGSYACYGGCYGGGSFACYGGCYGGGCYGGISYGGGCYGGVSYGSGCCGGGGGGTVTYPGGGGSASGGSPGGAGAGSGSGGQGGGGGTSTEATHALQDLKKALAELKKEQERLRVEALKQVADELRLKATEQKIDELRRSIDELKQRPIEELKRRPGSAPIPLPLPLPAPKGRPELPAPKPGEVRLEMPADALLVVNGKPIAVAPAYRTPPIQPGAEYVCTFEATVVRDGKNITRIKRLPLRAGAEVRLAFADMEPAEEHWTAAGESAHFTVRLPADARLTIDDVECPLTSGSRTFDTPSLVRGREYFYILKAEMVRDGRRIAQSKRVAFRPGERVTVSFEERRAEGLAAQ